MVTMFLFDEDKPFEVNFAAFLDHMKTVDAEMASILEANAAKLAAIVKNGERNSQARGDFNAFIGNELDKIVEAGAAEEAS